MKALENVRKLIDEFNLDAIVFYNHAHPIVSPNFLYVFQPRSGIFEHSYLVIYRDKIKLYTSKLEESAARESELYTAQMLQISTDKDQLFRELKSLSRIGMELDILPAKLYTKISRLGVQIIDISQELEEVRMIKSEEEINKIKKSIEISEKALRRVIDRIDLRNIDENGLKAELEYEISKFGCGLSFDTIVAFDENAAIPHYTTGSNNKKKANGVILIDFGAKCNHYVSDITRTFILEKNPEILKAYETVLNAQLKAIEIIREGIPMSEPDLKAREVIKNAGFPEYPHSLGHMIGILVHEGKRLSRYDRGVIKSNMVFTVEPGIYLEGKFGIRIEDDIVVHKKRAEVLSTYPKDLDDVII